MDAEIHAQNKRTAWELLRGIAADRSGDSTHSVEAAYRHDATWYGSHPLNETSGVAGIANNIWQPLKHSIPDLERRDLMVVGGETNGENLVATMGHLQGTFERNWLDIPATGGVVHIRYGEVHHVVDGKIARTHALWDMLDLIRQAGIWPLAPSLGAEGMWLGPATKNGLRLDSYDEERGAASQNVVLQMHAALLSFDSKSIKSMDDQKNQWSEDFLWYGPSGIGTTRGLKGFQTHHQIPFLRAFPDRNTADKLCYIGDGDYVVTGGWPSVTGTHLGPDWLGLAPTRKKVGMRVMDFYHVQNGRITENWVPIDIIDILRQMGVDVFGRVRHLTGINLPTDV